MIKTLKSQFSKGLVLGKKGSYSSIKNSDIVIAPNVRMLHVKVKKKAGTIKNSSRLWLQRHLNDPYVLQSKIDGYRSRAAYKLLEINQQFKFLKPYQKIIDLGAAPGGWSQVVSAVAHTKVVAIDLLPIQGLENVLCLEMDFLQKDTKEKLLTELGDAPDIVLSDMAANTTGHRKTDHYRTMYLCEEAAEFAIDVLKEGGHFLAKTFQGGAEATLLDKLKRHFVKVHHVKPLASRAASVELYILALNFKGKQ